MFWTIKIVDNHVLDNNNVDNNVKKTLQEGLVNVDYGYNVRYL